MKLPPFAGADADPESRMHWIQVPFEEVLALYEAQVLKVQRHHLRRARSSPHITGSDIPVHMNYTAGRTPDEKLRLVDGYTRITAIVNGDKPAPKKAWLGVVDCASNAEVEKLYDAMDSRQAVKRGRDAFEEGLRRASLLAKVESPVFVRGQAVSAIVAAAGTSDIRKATYEVRRGISVLDPLHIHAGRKGVPSGALAALLLLGAHEEDSGKVQRFASALERPDEVPKELKAEQAGALKCVVQLNERRESGALSGKNVVPIMELVLGYWDWQVRGAKGSVTPMSRGGYLASKRN
jgi:hypothetical protein